MYMHTYTSVDFKSYFKKQKLYLDNFLQAFFFDAHIFNGVKMW